MTRRCIAALLGALVCAGAWPACAAAESVTGPELRALARAAALDDPAALARLRAVDRVDGRPARLDAVLRDAAPAELRARLQALAEESPGAPGARPGDAGAVARDVLADERYHPSSFPRPLRGFLEDVGRVVAAPFRAAFEWLEDHLGSFGAWLVVAGAVLGAAVVVATRAGARRQAAAAAQRDASRPGGERASAAQLRAQADAAERAGDLDTALRLRFRAGLLDLDARELIVLRPALTNRELLRAVPSPTLGGLVTGFEAVAYGGRPAAIDDIRSAREGWPRVPEEARAR